MYKDSNTLIKIQDEIFDFEDETFKSFTKMDDKYKNNNDNDDYREIPKGKQEESKNEEKKNNCWR